MHANEMLSLRICNLIKMKEMSRLEEGHGVGYTETDRDTYILIKVG